VAFAVIALVLVGGDLGTALVLMAIVAVLLLVAGAPMRLFGLLGVGALGLIAVMSVTAPHRIRRFQYWLNPESDPLGAGWQALHGKYALASGGWWGLGLGASREKWGNLPEAHTDFIFAVVGEELGLLGTVTVLLLFAALVTGGLRIAMRARDPFTRYAAAGVTGWIAFQALVNVGAVLGILPITGVPLPLLSYGGSALLPLLAAIGMLLSFARAEPAAAAVLARRSAARAGRPAGRTRWARSEGDSRGTKPSRTAASASRRPDPAARGARTKRP
jgi:cell division protein FtsW